MKDMAKVYWMAFNTALQAKFEYRVDFLLGVATAFLRQTASLAPLFVVYHQTAELNGWTQDQVMLLFGMSAAALGFSELFFNHIWMVPGYVITGDLDRLLTYPVNSLFFLLITRPELHSFGNLITGFTLASISLHHSNAPWYAWVLVPFLMLLGCVIYTGALVIMTSISFKFIGPSSMHLMIPNTMLQATGYPLGIYPGAIQVFFMFLLPYGAFQFLPVSLFFDKHFTLWLLVSAPLAVVFFLWNASRAWKWGINQYESTGS